MSEVRSSKDLIHRLYEIAHAQSVETPAQRLARYERMVERYIPEARRQATLDDIRAAHAAETGGLH